MVGEGNSPSSPWHVHPAGCHPFNGRSNYPKWMISFFLVAWYMRFVTDRMKSKKNSVPELNLRVRLLSEMSAKSEVPQCACNHPHAGQTANHHIRTPNNTLCPTSPTRSHPFVSQCLFSARLIRRHCYELRRWTASTHRHRFRNGFDRSQLLSPLFRFFSLVWLVGLPRMHRRQSPCALVLSLSLSLFVIPKQVEGCGA